MAEDEDLGSIFDHLGEAAGTQKPKEAAPAPAADANAELLARISQMEADLRTQQYQQSPVAALPAEAHADLPAFTPGEWGDPLEDQAAFQANLAKYIDNVMSARETHAANVNAAERHKQNQADGLWSDFQAAYPQYKDHPDRIQFAAKKVVNAAQSKGMDMDRYLTAGKQDFFKEVEKEYTEVFGTPTEPEAKNSETPDDGRTAGIFGGIESGNKPAEREADKPGDMIKDLKDIQRSMGIF